MRWFLLPLLLLPLAAGCGGGAPGIEGVASAAAKVEKAKTMRFAVTAEFREGGRTVTTTGEGAIDIGRRRMRVSLDAPSFMPRLGAMEAIYLGGTIYWKWPSFGAERDKPWVKIEESAGAGFFDDAFPNPTEALELLRAAGDFEAIGEEDVRGARTTQYRGEVGDSEIAPEGSVVDAWVDADGYLRRLSFRDDHDAGAIEFFDFGTNIDIEAPPAEQVGEWDEVFESPMGTGGVQRIEVMPLEAAKGGPPK